MMPSAKQAAMTAISSLPESATYEDAMYRLYVLEKISKGEEAISKGEIITHDDLLREIQSW